MGKGRGTEKILVRIYGSFMCDYRKYQVTKNEQISDIKKQIEYLESKIYGFADL